MKQRIIGTTEFVKLPGVSQEFLAAKIDTGADSSAIWASNISQADGVLTYTLFAPGSTYYTGEPRQTKSFKVTSVRSSFGHDEMRYKVSLKVVIGTHKVTTWFTLADRSRNSFPILLGKSFLKDHFVVDVARNYVHGGDGPKPVLVITARPAETKEFLAQVKRQNEEAVIYKVAEFHDLLFEINGALSCVYNTADHTEPVANYALTYVKSHWHYPEPAAALAEYLTYKGRPFFDQEIKNYTSRSKLSELMKLATHGLPISHSYAGTPAVLLKRKRLITKELGFPLVLKNAASDRGKDNYLVANLATYEKIIGKAGTDDIYIAQQYVENDGFYRLNVFGKEVKMVVFRSVHPHSDPLRAHLNKPNGSANATKMAPDSLSADVLQLAVEGAITMGRQIAGVDVLQNKLTGEWFILEVNSSPQLRSGSHLKEKAAEFADFIDKELAR